MSAGTKKKSAANRPDSSCTADRKYYEIRPRRVRDFWKIEKQKPGKGKSKIVESFEEKKFKSLERPGPPLRLRPGLTAEL